MADAEYLEGAAFGGSWQGLQRLMNLAGALTSVALVAGVGWWGYQLAMRDVTGIPVVRALEGPMRVAPADPGGEIAGNMGLTVNAIAAEGEEAPPADRLVLAPRPVELAPEDLPAAALPPMPDSAPAAAANPSGVLGLIEVAGAPFTPVAPVEVPTETPPLPAAVLTEGGSPALALAALPGAATAVATPADPSLASAAPIILDGLLEPAAPPAGGLSDEAAMEARSRAQNEALEAALAEVLAEPVPAETAAGTPGRSPRPLARPSEAVVLAAAGASEPAPAVARTADPASITPGTRLVQLGAFDDEAGAIAEWNRLTARFGGLVADKSRVLQAAQSGGRSFVRLRAMGFADEADARRFCAALLAENAACIPVAQR
jgi:hypothetical protein